MKFSKENINVLIEQVENVCGDATKVLRLVLPFCLFVKAVIECFKNTKK